MKSTPVDESTLMGMFERNLRFHSLTRAFEKRSGLTIVQWCLLRKLRDMPGSSARELSTSLGVHPSTLTPGVKRLEARGLIFVMRDPNDSRKKALSITREGAEALEASAEKMHSLEWELS